MKKQLLFSAMLAASLMATAQVPFSYKEGESSLVYALPRTELCIQVETEKVIQKPGMFYQYSERYLATKDIITDEKTSYRLISVRVKPRAIPDPKRTFALSPSKKSQASHLTVNAQGILCGVNTSCESVRKDAAPVLVLPIDNSKAAALLPLGEEYMMAGSTAKLAEGAAKQIYRIRESRMSLLTADVERLPADGASFSAMLDGLNKQERKLTELFVGSTTTEIQTQTVYLTPTTAVANDVVFRLSALNGLVSSEDLSGTPYYISIQPTPIQSVQTDFKANKENTTIYTILPASTQVSIGDGKSTFFSEQFLVPQFGVIIPLSEELLKKPKVKIRIDQQTGRLLGIADSL